LLQTLILQEFVEREHILAHGHARNIIEFNEKNADTLPPLVVVIDEFADLTDQLSGDRNAKQAFYDTVRRIAQLGRKRGVHLILCTQRPSADLVPTNIRSLLNSRVSLRVNDSTASRMILDEVGAEQLQSRGDLLFKEENTLIRGQGYFMSNEQLESILQTLNL
jgi:DNA segregation ATPase FtsK/SpoIIIE-like protein